MAIASCVKPEAVPGPPPGPWDAKAVSVHIRPIAIKVVTIAGADIGSLFPDDAMTISCDE
jgi:hypothetical protein